MRMNCPILTRDKTANDWSGARRKNSASEGKAIEILMARASGCDGFNGFGDGSLGCWVVGLALFTRDRTIFKNAVCDRRE